MDIIKNKHGISLVVLVITIVVMSILAGIVIINVKDTDIIDKASEVSLREDILSFQTELKAYVDNKRFDAITTGIYYSTADDELLIDNTTFSTIKQVIPSFSSEYENIFAIKDGELFYVSSNLNDNIKKILNDLNVRYQEN